MPRYLKSALEKVYAAFLSKSCNTFMSFDLLNPKISVAKLDFSPIILKTAIQIGRHPSQYLSYLRS